MQRKTAQETTLAAHTAEHARLDAQAIDTAAAQGNDPPDDPDLSSNDEDDSGAEDDEAEPIPTQASVQETPTTREPQVEPDRVVAAEPTSAHEDTCKQKMRREAAAAGDEQKHAANRDRYSAALEVATQNELAQDKAHKDKTGHHGGRHGEHHSSPKQKGEDFKKKGKAMRKARRRLNQSYPDMKPATGNKASHKLLHMRTMSAQKHGAELHKKAGKMQAKKNEKRQKNRKHGHGAKHNKPHHARHAQRAYRGHHGHAHAAPTPGLDAGAVQVGAPYGAPMRSEFEQLALESANGGTVPTVGFGGHVHVFTNAHGDHAGCIIYALDNEEPLYHDPHGEPVGCLVFGYCLHSGVFTASAHEFSPEAERVYCKLAQDKQQLCAHKLCEHFAQMPGDAKGMVVAGFATMLERIGA